MTWWILRFLGNYFLPWILWRGQIISSIKGPSSIPIECECRWFWNCKVLLPYNLLRLTIYQLGWTGVIACHCCPTVHGGEDTVELSPTICTLTLSRHMNPSKLTKFARSFTAFWRHLKISYSAVSSEIALLSFAATIMSVAYGISVRESDYSYILNIGEALKGMAEAGVPGASLVDFIPISPIGSLALASNEKLHIWGGPMPKLRRGRSNLSPNK